MSTTSDRDQKHEDSVVHIIISTDNHLGFKERDPVRGMDSFAAFEEVLAFSKSRNADMLLLGGDIFHDNKPSRRTMHQTFDLLREYTLSDAPVSFQIISDQKDNFEGRRGCVNYEDPYYSVGLPVFAIHGNHDDPTREGGNEALAALDLLSVTNFINYFGKADKVDDVTIKPILFQKGLTKIALYGLGNIRDERLNRMWTKQKVKFLKPTKEEGSFFYILVLHQNRATGRGRRNAIYESMIPDWFDVVVWGHEHECQTNFEESVHGNFHVIQPGSTVATSLVEGESQPKHLMILDIKFEEKSHGEIEHRYRLTNHRLKNVRPFITDEIQLDNSEYNLDPEDVKIEKSIDLLLDDHVKTMVERVRRERAEIMMKDAINVTENKLCKMQDPMQVLVRLKVDRLGFQTINNQRFGARFVGDVANPSDILMFHQRKKVMDDGKSSSSSSKRTKHSSALSLPVPPDLDDELNVEDLIAEQLQNSEKKLRLLKEKDLKEALEQYVQKQQASAIIDAVQATLEDTQAKITANKEANTVALIQDAVEKENQYGSQISQFASSSSSSSSSSKTNSTPKPKAVRKRGNSDDDDDDDEDEFEDMNSEHGEEEEDRFSSRSHSPAPAKKLPTRSSRSNKKANTSHDMISDDEGDEDFNGKSKGGGVSDFDFDDSADEVEEVVPKKTRKAPAPKKKKETASSSSLSSRSNRGGNTVRKTQNSQMMSSTQASSSSRRALPGWASQSQSQTPSDYSTSSPKKKKKSTNDDWA